MKVIVAELSQETNSFSPVITTLDDFKRYGIYSGTAYREAVRGVDIESEGIFVALEQSNIEYIAAIRMRAQAGGRLQAEVVDYFIEHLQTMISQNPLIEGAVICLHGATQSTKSDDVCGDVIRHLRTMLGEDAIISASFDLHANITKEIFEHADYICGYHTYPHIDFYETGFRAARFCADALVRKMPYHMAWCSLPMITPASGYTTNEGPFHTLVEKARAMVDSGTLVDYSIFQMQPWLDVAGGGSAVVAVSASQDHASKCVEELTMGLKAIRHHMVPHLHSIQDIVYAAEHNNSGKPVLLVDFSDSANAGASGDNSDVLANLLAMDRTHIETALIVTDSPAVERAFSIGIGNTAEFQLGGTIDTVRSRPVTVRARVRSLHDGEFKLSGPSRGLVRHIGLCAVLSVQNIDILVTKTMASTGDSQLYRHFGIEPMLYKLVMVKSNTSFYASYGDICSRILFTDTGCAATANLQSLPFQNLPKTFHPFSNIDEFDVAEQVKIK